MLNIFIGKAKKSSLESKSYNTIGQWPLEHLKFPLVTDEHVAKVVLYYPNLNYTMQSALNLITNIKEISC